MNTRRLPRSRLMALALVVMTTGAGALAGPVSAAGFHFNPLPWVQFAATLTELAPGGDATIQALVGPSSLSYGSDGRLTVLLVGSDWRQRLSGTGERTDVMMVVTINPKTKQVAAVSLPRDVGNVPIAPGVIFSQKVNGLFKSYKRQYGTRELALEHLRQAFQYTFQIQIDYVAYVRFGGVESLVQQVGGVPVQVERNIYDNKITDDRVTNHPPGAKFLASSYTLELGSNAPLCYGPGASGNWTSVPNCTRALMYLRSRHGPGNNDWVRAHRQQDFLVSAVQRVLGQSNAGNSYAPLYALGSKARSMPTDFYTTLPIGTNADLFALYSLLNGASSANFNQAVLKPPTYAHNVAGTTKQELNIAAVRALTASWFGPVN